MKFNKTVRYLRLLLFVLFVLTTSLLAQSSSEFNVTSGSVEVYHSFSWSQDLISFNLTDSQSNVISTYTGTLMGCGFCGGSGAPGSQVEAAAEFHGTGQNYEGYATGSCPVPGISEIVVIMGELGISTRFTLPSTISKDAINMTVPIWLSGSLACCSYKPWGGQPVCASPNIDIPSVVGDGTITLYPDSNGNYFFNGVIASFPYKPPYKAFVKSPINSDGSSVFKSNRGVIPVKFSLTNNDAPTCDLPPATIAVPRTAGGKLGTVDESIYAIQANSGSNFRIDPTACQYIYNLAASSLGPGTYLVQISINGIAIGHAVFALK